MLAKATPRSAGGKPFSKDDFLAWLPDGGHTMIALKRERDHWSALFMEFNIAGTGNTAEEALREAKKLFWGYLQYCFMDGRTFAEARRPIPRRLRLWYRVSPHLSRFWRGVFAEVEEANFDTAFLNAAHAPHLAA